MLGTSLALFLAAVTAPVRAGSDGLDEGGERDSLPGVAARPCLAARRDATSQLIWQEARGGTFSVMHRRWPATGGAVRLSRADVDAADPAVAVAADFVVVAWRERGATSEQLVATCSRDGGLTFDPPRALATSRGAIHSPAVATAAGSCALISWIEETDEGRDVLQLARTADAGRSFATQPLELPFHRLGGVTLASGGLDATTGRPRFAVASIGSRRTESPARGAVVVRASIDGGETFPDERSIAWECRDSAAGRPCSLTLVANEQGALLAAWLDTERDPQRFGIWAQRSLEFGADGSWLDGAALDGLRVDACAAGRLAAYEPVLALDAAGDGIVAFTAWSDGPAKTRLLELLVRRLPATQGEFAAEERVAAELVDASLRLPRQRPSVAISDGPSGARTAVLAWIRSGAGNGASQLERGSPLGLAVRDPEAGGWRRLSIEAAPACSDAPPGGLAMALQRDEERLLALVAWDERGAKLAAPAVRAVATPIQ